MDYTAFLTPTLGVGGVVILAVVMLLRGDLVSRRQVDALLSVKDQQISFLEKTNEEQARSLRERDHQLAEMMLTSRTTRRVLAALPEAAGLEGGTDAPASEEA